MSVQHQDGLPSNNGSRTHVSARSRLSTVPRSNAVTSFHHRRTNDHDQHEIVHETDGMVIDDDDEVMESVKPSNTNHTVRPRTYIRMNRMTLLQLQLYFIHQTPRPSSDQRMLLTAALSPFDPNVSFQKITRWFQNTRWKYKKAHTQADDNETAMDEDRGEGDDIMEEDNEEDDEDDNDEDQDEHAEHEEEADGSDTEDGGEEDDGDDEDQDIPHHQSPPMMNAIPARVINECLPARVLAYNSGHPSSMLPTMPSPWHWQQPYWRQPQLNTMPYSMTPPT